MSSVVQSPRFAEANYAPRPITQAGRDAAERALAWKTAQPIILMVVLRAVPGPLSAAAYVLDLFYSLSGRRQALVSLMLLWLFNTFTHAFGQPPGFAAIFRHLIVFSAAASVLVIHAREPPPTRAPVLLAFTGVLSLLLLLHSVFISSAPDISALKAFSFVLAIHALLRGWSSLAPHQRRLAETHVWGILYGLAILSTPLVVSGRGYMKNGRGFQGLLEHPQGFGPCMAIVATWLCATWLTKPRMPQWQKILVWVALAWAYRAQARIAALVLLIGLVTTVAIGPISRAMNQWRRIPRLLGGRLALLVVGGGMTVILAGPFLAPLVTKFIAKTGRATTAYDAAWESRGFLVEEMQANIREHPLTGIGFGVGSTPEKARNVIRDPWFGLAIMAPVEKGVLPVAIVEEMGFPLAILYGIWFLALLLSAARGGTRYAAVCAAALVMNISEAVFFSPGGGGLFILVIVTMAATAPRATSEVVQAGGAAA